MGARIIGDYSGRLSNDGERIVLTSPLGQNVIDFTYNDVWHRRSDGEDYSLVLVDPSLTGLDQSDWNSPESWIDSGVPEGTPGSLPPSTLGYANWLAQHALADVLASQDSDSDGTSDLFEYVFGMHPLRRDQSSVQLFEDRVEYDLREDRGDVLVSSAISRTMQTGNWIPASATSDSQSGYRKHVVSWPNESRHFFRLEANRP